MSHRTQLILDEWQYDGIRAIAESSGVSLSSVVREAVSKYLGGRKAAQASSLDELQGLGRDAGLSGGDHDAVLYGPPVAGPGTSPPRRARNASRRRRRG